MRMIRCVRSSKTLNTLMSYPVASTALSRAVKADWDQEQDLHSVRRQLWRRYRSAGRVFIPAEAGGLTIVPMGVQRSCLVERSGGHERTEQGRL
jgi:hypothetical protein